MPVLLIAEAGLPEEAYAQIADKMTPVMREAKGFICHAGGPDPAGGGGWSRSGSPKRMTGTGLTTTSSPTCHQASCQSIRITRFALRSPSRRSPRYA
jgi:hypothetical protein